MNLMVIDDDDALRHILSMELGRAGHRVSSAADAAEGLRRTAEAEPEVVLLDLSLPDQPGLEVLRRLRAERPAVQVVVLTAHGSVDAAIQAMKLGAFDFLQKPCALAELELTLQRACEHGRLGEENARLREGLAGGARDADFAGCGPAFEDLQRFVAKVAASDSTVLLRGETGTGKEMVARAIHRRSRRREAPFVVVDCASLQESLLQSELFGHEKGAFTGAARLKYGLFETGDKGTVFLDEIGDVTPAVQVGLLRVLETSAFRRVGGTREVRVDVRVLAATSRDLEKLMEEGRFRPDLYFRLNTIHLEIPPLRRRRAEIGFLFEHFAARHAERGGARRSVSAEAMEALSAYGWPGNVRELRHVVERSLVMADGEVIRREDLPPELLSAAGKAPASLRLVDVEARHIARVLAEAGGRRALAASLLGISERNLYRKIREYRLEGGRMKDEG